MILNIIRIPFHVCAWLLDIIESLNYFSRLIGIRAALYFLISELLKRESLMLVEIAGEKIYIRTIRSELKLAVNCLLYEEFGGIESNSPSIIIDAGANIGASTVYFAKRYPEARIIAIEPEQENYEILVKNTSRHQNIVTIKAALWYEKDTRTIRHRFTGPWGYTVSTTDYAAESTGQEVDCITIPSIMNDYHIEYIDILKMDIEGGEKSVFEYADDWIDKVAIVTVELHDRIVMGSSKAFYLATQEFPRFELSGEKIIAYRT